MWLKSSKLTVRSAAFAHFLMRKPRRLVKLDNQLSENIISQPALRKKPKVYRARYLDQPKALTRQSVPQSSGENVVQDKVVWRNFHPENDAELLSIMRRLVRGERYKALILLEGKRLIEYAVEKDVKICQIIFSDPRELYNMRLPSANFEQIRISKRRMSAWSLLDSPPGVMAIAEKPPYSRVIEARTEKALPLFVICDGIKDPNNMGLLIRGLASIGCQSVLTLKGCSSVWNVKVLRCASGGHFSVPIYENLAIGDLLEYLPANFSLFMADASSTNDPLLRCGFDQIPTSCPAVLIVGNEATGLSKDVASWAINNQGNMCWSAVVPECYTATELPLVKFRLLHTECSGVVSQCVRFLGQLLPWSSHSYMKRVRVCRTDNCARFDILLCPHSDQSEADASDVVTKLADTCNVDKDVFALSSTLVPSERPLTRRQFQWGAKVWPLVFHEDKRLASLFDCSVFTEADKESIRKNMQCAIEMAKKAPGENGCRVGCVIVHPVSGIIVAATNNSLMRHHPLKHATVVAIDLVANFHAESDSFEIAPDFILSPRDKFSKAQLSSFYLCTGFDCYLTREPCAMCAVALLHARIRRVFYGYAMPNGALGSKAMLHQLKEVNHRFDVFKGILKKECQEVAAMQ